MQSAPASDNKKQPVFDLWRFATATQSQVYFQTHHQNNVRLVINLTPNNYSTLRSSCVRDTINERPNADSVDRSNEFKHNTLNFRFGVHKLERQSFTPQSPKLDEKKHALVEIIFRFYQNKRSDCWPGLFMPHRRFSWSPARAPQIKS